MTKRFTTRVTTQCALLLVAGLFAAALQAKEPTWLRPFSDQSPWNAKPTAFTLGTVEVPKSLYFPIVAEGDYSVRVFNAVASDPPVSVRGLTDGQPIWIADAEVRVPQVDIPHWPAGVVPATGGDGHADIVDAAANRIHSFYQLKLVDGQWRAAQYTWSALDGRGWGEPAHYFQGSRAAGVPTLAGLIRTHEVNDGKPMYTHALAMSMPFNALSANPAYMYPATAADIDAAKNNTGVFPEGALMMLPRDFDLAAIKDPRLLKVARTLQTYGAYVVDANGGTPYAIYVEIGSRFELMKPGVWDGPIADQLDLIRSGLRQVVAVTAWQDANGAPFTPPKNLNLLSLRGPWSSQTGEPGAFDSWQQVVTFPANGRRTVQSNASGRSMQTVNWATPKAGEAMSLTVTGSGGSMLRLDLVDESGRPSYTSGDVKSGASVAFRWPAGAAKPVVTVSSGSAGGGTVGVRLVSKAERS